MSVFRVNKNKNYTVMSNTHLKDKNLSLKAKGLLSLMLSLPDNWDYSINGLIKICKEGEKAIKNTLDELKERNYLVVTKLFANQTKTGRIEYIYDIFENPVKKSKHLEQQGKTEKNQDPPFVGVENVGVENVALQNAVQLNTKNKKTKNKEKVYKKKSYNDYEQRHYSSEEYRELENRITK